MGKLLSWIAIGLLVWFAFKMLQVSQRRQQGAARRDDPASPAGGPAGARGPSAQSLPGERMVRCEHCGVYLPVSDAVVAGERHYCSLAHRDAGPAA